MRISSPATYCPAPNDICTNAISITHWGSTVCGSPTTGNMVGASDNDETGDCTLGTEKAIWYSFTATNTSASVSVVGSYYFNAVIGALTTCGSPTVPAGGTCVNNSLLGIPFSNNEPVRVVDVSVGPVIGLFWWLSIASVTKPLLPLSGLLLVLTVPEYCPMLLGATPENPLRKNEL